MSSTDAVPAV